MVTILNKMEMGTLPKRSGEEMHGMVTASGPSPQDPLYVPQKPQASGFSAGARVLKAWLSPKCLLRSPDSG